VSRGGNTSKENGTEGSTRESAMGGKRLFPVKSVIKNKLLLRGACCHFEN